MPYTWSLRSVFIELWLPCTTGFNFVSFYLLIYSYIHILGSELTGLCSQPLKKLIIFIFLRKDLGTLRRVGLNCDLSASSFQVAGVAGMSTTPASPEFSVVVQLLLPGIMKKHTE